MGITQSRSDEDLAAEIVELQKKALIRDWPNPKDTLRDAHPKTLGLLKGEFEIANDLPDELKVGFFANGGQVYPCHVRFSNANPTPKSDLLVGKRGCAIQLLSPNDDETPINQDFVLMNTPIMPLGTPQIFRDVIYFAQVSFVLLCIKLFFQCQLHKFRKFLSFRNLCDSILGEKFHSTTPYAFGDDRVVKYGLIPTSYKGPSVMKRVGYNYLTIEMQEYLESNEATFDFFVQFQTDPKKMPLEDASVIWDEKLSPFVKVATLRIPPQIFTLPERFELAEQLRFNIEHAFPEHKPLGGLNKVRSIVYRGEFIISRICLVLFFLK